MSTDISNIKQFCDKAAFFCAISFMIFIPFSTALMNIFIFLTLIFVLFTGNLKNNLIMAWRNPVSKVALILFFLLILSFNWTIDSSEAFDVLKKYNELWYIALILPLFNSDRRRNIGIQAYLISMGIVLVGVYLMYFEIIMPIEWTLKGREHHFNVDGGFASHIITNILMAFAMFIAAHKSVLSRSFFKVPYIIYFVFSAYYVLFISTGTSGQILAIILILLFIIQHTGVRATLIIPPIFALIIIGTYPGVLEKLGLPYVKNLTYSSENNGLRFAVDKIVVRYHHLISTDTAGNNTRPRQYFYALKLIRDEPWIGTGVGSYSEALRSKEPEFYAATRVGKNNPHNEFLMISVQLGAIGLFVLLYLFYTQAASSDRIREKEYKYIAQGLVVLIIIGCMGNSMLLDSKEGHFWAFFSALLFSNLDEDLLEAKS